MADKYLMTREEAIYRLTMRWNEQVKLFPRMNTPLALYIKRNIRHVRVFGSLNEYRSEGSREIHRA